MLDFYLLIPCYNNLEGLIVSLRSVEYHKEKYAVLVVDDGSIMPITLSALPDDLLKKHTIEIITLSENKGITEALNTGLRIILERNNALYTARLDCGDTCMPDRFYKQIHFLSVNTHISLLGSICLFADAKRKTSYVYYAAEKHDAIRKQMHLKCSFIHPTVVFRNKSIKDTNLYPYNFPYAEDYAYFFELIIRFQAYILQEILVQTQINTDGISVKKRKEQIKSKINVINHYGDNKQLIFFGTFKQYISLLLPYKFILVIKNIISQPH